MLKPNNLQEIGEIKKKNQNLKPITVGWRINLTPHVDYYTGNVWSGHVTYH